MLPSPLQSYRIWFTPRTGSSLLCKGLEMTGIAGKPGEFFNLINTNSLCEQHQISSNYQALKSKLWEMGTSANGVFGIKHSMYQKGYSKIFREVLELRGIAGNENINHEEIWADIFPNCKHIFLTRRNKIRQAVSWWKAIKNEIWHLTRDQSHQNAQAFYDKNYNFDAFTHLFKEAMLRECAIQAYFSKHKISPMTIVYEDYIQDFEGTIRSIVGYLDLDTSALEVKKMYYKKTADDFSEQWVQRFRKELQEQMGHLIW